MEPQKTPNSQNDFEKEQKWRHQLPDFKLRYKAIIINTTDIKMYTDQWNRIENAEINP